MIDGVDLENANGESCGGTFAESFAHSCNSVFAPLGVKVGAAELVSMAERFGWNKSPSLDGAQKSTIPAASDIKSPLDLGSSAIGQGRVLATPLEMASVAQTVANDGVRVPPTLQPGLRQTPKRVISRPIADTLEGLMLGRGPLRHRDRRPDPGRGGGGQDRARPSWATPAAPTPSRAPRTPTPGSPPTRRPSGRGSPSACCSCATERAERRRRRRRGSCWDARSGSRARR